MRELFCFGICYVLASAVSAQTGYFQGVTPRPSDVYAFPSSLTVTRSAPAGGAGSLVPALYTHVTTDAERIVLADKTCRSHPAEPHRRIADVPVQRE